MDIQELLAKAFDIGNKTSYRVNFPKQNGLTETKYMTYTELGMYLIANIKNIISVDIILKE